MGLGAFSGPILGPLVRIDGNSDSNKYRDILANQMLPFAHEKLSPTFLFQQDSAGPHIAQLLTGPIRRLPGGRKLRLPGWFSLNNIPTPVASPDISPIENVWAIVKEKLTGKRFKTKDELWQSLQEAWNSITALQLMKLVESMPRRMNALIISKGGPTKY